MSPANIRRILLLTSLAAQCAGAGQDLWTGSLDTSLVLLFAPRSVMSVAAYPGMPLLENRSFLAFGTKGNGLDGLYLGGQKTLTRDFRLGGAVSGIARSANVSDDVDRGVRSASGSGSIDMQAWYAFNRPSILQGVSAEVRTANYHDSLYDAEYSPVRRTATDTSSLKASLTVGLSLPSNATLLFRGLFDRTLSLAHKSSLTSDMSYSDSCLTDDERRCPGVTIECVRPGALRDRLMRVAWRTVYEDVSWLSDGVYRNDASVTRAVASSSGPSYDKAWTDLTISYAQKFTVGKLEFGYAPTANGRLSATVRNEDLPFVDRLRKGVADDAWGRSLRLTATLHAEYKPTEKLSLFGTWYARLAFERSTEETVFRRWNSGTLDVTETSQRLRKRSLDWKDLAIGVRFAPVSRVVFTVVPVFSASEPIGAAECTVLF